MGLSEIFEKQERIMEPLRMAAKQLELTGVTQYAGLSTAIPALQIGAVGSAYFSGAYQFENPLGQKLHDIYAPLENVLGNIPAIENIMGTHFQELMQPSLYLPNTSGSYETVGSLASVIPNTIPIIDTSWIQQINPWMTNISHLATIDTSVLAGIDTTFSKLVNLEKETSALELITSHSLEITSTAAQLASIAKSLSGIADQWREMIAPVQLLDSYSNFALRQHRLIQKAASANDDRSVTWRLNLLDATSKFVDRQITWASEFTADIQEDIDVGESHDFPGSLDIAAIPQYIGYTKHADKEIDEALVESAITAITEKGKLIAWKARFIQKLCKTNKRGQLFGDAELYVDSYMVLAGTFCKDKYSFESVIDALYNMFCEQCEAISAFVDLNNFDCIECVKTLKSEKNYPERQKEISNLQNVLYDRFLKLEDAIIDKLGTSTGDAQLAVPIDTMLSEDKWTEESLSKNILRALLNVQGNKIYYGKKEDELNDGVRDNLGMVYDMKDQTRQGISPNGKDAGEVDLQIYREGLPIVMLEGLKVSSVNRSYIQIHIDKVLTCYDPFGCPYVYIIIYVTAKKFADFWESCLEYIRDEYDFPYEVKEEIREINHIYTTSRHAKAVLLRDNKEVNVHFYALSVQ